MADRRPRLVAMTANAMAGDRDLCLRSGLDDYISKPVRLEDLHRVLAGGWANPSASPGGTAGEAGIDLGALQDFATTVGGDDPDFLADLVRSFLESTDQVLAELREAHQRGDGATLQRAAHTLKSSSAAVSATALADLCRQLEQTLLTGSGADVTAQVAAIQRAAAQVKTALAALISSPEAHPYGHPA
jgi:HPt (histidine-containing phosphotransfer) domain-containing protein